MDFTSNFNTLSSYLRDQSIIELYDNENTLFYKTNAAPPLQTLKEIVYTNSIVVDELNNNSWKLRVLPSEKLELARDLHIINAALVFGLILSITVARSEERRVGKG